ncbi:MAG: signal peptidase II [Hyphomicrobium sp.]|nr:signal peptidase II [Hyphomicrobium sp.]
MTHEPRDDLAHSGMGNNWLWGKWAPTALAVAASTLVLDQVNKLWFLIGWGIRDLGPIEVTPFLNIVYTLNTGVSYSMLNSPSYSWQLGLAAFAMTASAALWIWLARAGESRAMAWGIGLIIGGAIGNAIDRLWLGGVADFYQLHAFGHSWYIFNIADVGIVAGVMLLLYDSFAPSRKGAANPG